jgi:hypothetical protein
MGQGLTQGGVELGRINPESAGPKLQSGTISFGVCLNSRLSRDNSVLTVHFKKLKKGL